MTAVASLQLEAEKSRPGRSGGRLPGGPASAADSPSPYGNAPQTSGLYDYSNDCRHPGGRHRTGYQTFRYRPTPGRLVAAPSRTLAVQPPGTQYSIEHELRGARPAGRAPHRQGPFAQVLNEPGAGALHLTHTRSWCADRDRGRTQSATHRGRRTSRCSTRPSRRVRIWTRRRHPQHRRLQRLLARAHFRRCCPPRRWRRWRPPRRSPPAMPTLGMKQYTLSAVSRI